MALTKTTRKSYKRSPEEMKEIRALQKDITTVL